MQDSQDVQPFQITKVWARNFRSMADMSVELDRLTVLVGPNAAGKSNVLDILRFIKDALRFDLEVAISLRHGPEAIQHRSEQGQASEIELGLTAHERRRHSSFTLDYHFVIAINADGDFRVRQERVLVRPDALGQSFEFRIEDGKLIYPDSLLSDDISPRFGSSEDPRDLNMSELWLLRTVRMGLRRSWISSERAETPFQISRTLDRFHFQMRQSRFYHIFPNTLRELQRVGNANPLAEDASNLSSVLRAMKKQGSGTMSAFRDSLSLLVPGISDLDVESAGGYLVVRLKHGAGQNGTWIDLSQESDGTIRLLGLLVALYQRRNLSLIGIEEPELTVHPGAMATLADLLNEASLTSQVIVTTHSPDLIDCLTDYRAIETLRIVELVDGVTVVRRVANSQIEAVRKHLFSPGELHRMGELESVRG